MKRIIKFRAYTEISNEVLGMKYDVPHNYNDTVMQFTGLLDRNGKEIYEGDITSELGIIEWGNDESAFLVSEKNNRSIKNHLWTQMIHPIEIIGNRFENPELLVTD